MSSPSAHRRLALLLAMLLLPLILCANSVRDIRFGQHEDFVRCVVETESPAEFRFRNASAGENKVSFQFLNIRPGAPQASGAVAGGALASANTDYDSAQQALFLHMETAGAVRIETLRLQNPHRLVIDVYKDSGGVVAAATPAPVKEAEPAPINITSGSPQRKIVVIDAGHGGHHRGGHGFVKGRKVEEAELTLPIAFELEKLVRANPLLEPRLTRRNDTYIGLRERTRLAEQFNGDLFISIHYNAVPGNASKNKARGLELYTWSNASRNTASKYLEDLENEEGGSSDLSQANREAKMVLSKLMLDTLEEQALNSRILGRELEQEFLKNSYFKAHYRGLKSARFKVLENYNMPSVLIEVAFLSHPDEAARAVTKEFQRDVARHIYDGIVDYFEATDPAFRDASARAVAKR